MHDNLSMILMQRIAIIAVIAYVFSQTQAFRFMFKEQTSIREKFTLIVFFSAVSIIGTYFGIPIEGAIANVRDTGTIVAGLLGGPLVGTVTGFISGMHRIYLDGFTALQCGVTTILGGIVSGYINIKVRPQTPEWITGIVTGTGVTLFSMGLILLTAKPYTAAWSLVSQITVPMISANSLGIAAFMLIIHNALRYQTKIAAIQTHKALRIANATLPYLRQGLNPISALKVATTIMNMTTASAVALTNCEKILAHIGKGSDHHIAEGPISTNTTKTCLATGHIAIAQTAKEIDCSYKECPLKSAVVVPLFCQNEIVGTLKIYHSREEAMTSLDIEFAQGLGQIFSTQLELAKLQQKAELAAEAELKALRAQINPHFLFNALNTIVSLCRTNPEEARNLIIELGEFFRQSMKTARDFVTIKEELEHVDSYLTLEKARFGRRLAIVKNIDENVLENPIPAFTLQPLVENAVKHGILSQSNGGTVLISASISENHIVIDIEDDGQGIASDKLKQITLAGYGKGAGVGLTNVNERLKSIYGPDYALTISSDLGRGTIVRLRIPFKDEGVIV